MKKILNETQRDYILSLAKNGSYDRELQLLSVLTAVDEAEKLLAELQPPDLRTEELTFKVTYDANVVKPAEVTEELKRALKGLTFISVDLILPGPEDIVMSPGEGFRWLYGKEILQEGDQCINKYTNEWECTSLAGNEIVSTYCYRRRIRS